jgi:ABC-type polysaccharide/polyol phosphate transport system ATPase subunit
MAKVELDNVSLTFHVRQHKRVSFKEYVVRALFSERVNPRMVVHALAGVSLKAGPGDRVGIIGHNGAGKSTLLKTIAGIYPPTEGTRHVEGKICSLFDITLGFEMEATGRENIMYRSYLQGETPKSLKSKIDEIAEFTELGDFLDLPVRHYSAGMMMRLAFSIATTTQPEILLVDEVLAVGDLAFQQKAQARMKEMMSRAGMMFVVAHDLATLANVCNRAIWLTHGQMVMEGDTKEVIAAYVASVNNPAPPPTTPPLAAAA